MSLIHVKLGSSILLCCWNSFNPVRMSVSRPLSQHQTQCVSTCPIARGTGRLKYTLDALPTQASLADSLKRCCKHEPTIEPGGDHDKRLHLYAGRRIYGSVDIPEHAPRRLQPGRNQASQQRRDASACSSLARRLREICSTTTSKRRTVNQRRAQRKAHSKRRGDGQCSTTTTTGWSKSRRWRPRAAPRSIPSFPSRLSLRVSRHGVKPSQWRRLREGEMTLLREA